MLAENAFLRQQLAVLHRQTKTPRLSRHDRLALLLLAPWVPNWKPILQIVQLETLLRWHRGGFRLFWRWKSRRRGPARRPDTQTVYAFVIVHLGSRRVVQVNATAHPTDAWVSQQLREATPFGEKAKHLIGDNDTKYGQPAFHAAAKMCGLDIIHTPYEAPRANAICERFIGSLRRECLDHRLVPGDRQLVRVLKEYSGYLSQARPHPGLAQQTPESRRLGQANMTPVQPAGVSPSSLAPGRGAGRKLGAAPVLNGLHHSYAWVA